ncbi:hypothetical protein MHH81_21145 [Psychrobacillus sp. FSL H8-0484]|uniref:hypothetical protein n=1 Tax=Psychrobacillus sp. FSL H8-0484 TaxID=2921390 RepID=UPI0030FA1D1B
MKKRPERLKEALNVSEITPQKLRSKLKNLDEQTIIDYLKKFANNTAIEGELSALLHKNSNKTNTKILMDQLEQRKDIYTIVYIIFSSLRNKTDRLSDNRIQGIVNAAFYEFKLTNSSIERELNRQQVEKLVLDKEFKQLCYKYIYDTLEERISTDDTLEDFGNIDELTIEVFAAIIYEMLFIQTDIHLIKTNSIV